MATNAFAAGAYAATQGLAGFSPATKGVSPTGGADFGSLLRNVVDNAAQSGQKAETQALAAASGKADVVDVVTAVAESEAALETLVAVRDRVIAAYEDIMRMPI
jgi:flagellar hook-basal body complex protein FliE